MILLSLYKHFRTKKIHFKTHVACCRIGREELTIKLQQIGISDKYSLQDHKTLILHLSLDYTYHLKYKVSSDELGENELALARDLYSTIHVTLTGAWPVLLALVPLKVPHSKHDTCMSKNTNGRDSCKIYENKGDTNEWIRTTYGCNCLMYAFPFKVFRLTKNLILKRISNACTYTFLLEFGYHDDLLHLLLPDHRPEHAVIAHLLLHRTYCNGMT